MATEQAGLIRKYSRSDLKGLWKNLRDGSDAGFAAGKAFEFFILRSFQLDGAEVVWPFEVPSITSQKTTHQVDGAIYSDGLAAIVECKHWSDKVSYHEIAYLRALLARRPHSTLGLFFSPEGFTLPAIEMDMMSGDSRVLLWERDDIEWAIQRPGGFVKGLKLKFRHAVEHARTNYSLKEAPNSARRPIVVLEGDRDKRVLVQLLDHEGVKAITVTAHGASSAVSFAKRALEDQAVAVALVLDSDQVDPARSEARRRAVSSLLSNASNDSRWHLCLMEPELERSLLATPGFATAVLQREATAEELATVERAKSTLTKAKLEQLSADALVALRENNASLGALLGFLRSSNS